MKSGGVARERSEQAGGERDGEKSREGRGREEKNVYVGALYILYSIKTGKGRGNNMTSL